MEYSKVQLLFGNFIFVSLFFLAFIKIANPLKVNRKANFWFGLFLLLYATFWIEEVFVSSGFENVNIHLLIFIHLLQILAPICFYISILYFTSPVFKLKSSFGIHLILPMVFIVIKIFSHINPVINISVVKSILITITLTLAITYTSLSMLRIHRHKSNVQMFASNTERINLKWLEYIIIQVLVLAVIITIYNILSNSRDLNIYLNSLNLYTIFFIGYHSLKQKEIFPAMAKEKEQLTFIEEDNDIEKSKKSLIACNELDELKGKLTALMVDKKPYLDSELNLNKLAGKLNITPHQLSFLINDGFNENFFQFVNKYRVEEAKLILKSNDQNLTMLAVAFESGFNSKTAFNTTFKKFTLQTPSQYKKMGSDS